MSFKHNDIRVHSGPDTACQIRLRTHLLRRLAVTIFVRDRGVSGVGSKACPRYERTERRKRRRREEEAGRRNHQNESWTVDGLPRNVKILLIHKHTSAMLVFTPFSKMRQKKTASALL